MKRFIVALPLFFPSLAFAGREPFNQVLDNEVLPARGAELESKITDKIGTPGGAGDETASWWGVAFGLSDQVELVLPLEVSYSHADGTTNFTRYAAEVRWRMAKPGPPVVMRPIPMLRLAVERGNSSQTLEAQADLTVGTDLSKKVHTAVDLGGNFVSDASESTGHLGIGVTGNVTGALRLGGEVDANAAFIPTFSGPNLAAGPDVSYTTGPFWITAGGVVGLGATIPDPVVLRLSWGVEF